jgi:hypothetical protein
VSSGVKTSIFATSDIFFSVKWRIITMINDKVAPVLHLLGRHLREGVISIGAGMSTWRLAWGFLRFSHPVRVNAVYLKCVTTLCCTPLTMYYSLTMAPFDSTKKGWPGWQIYFLLSGEKMVIYTALTLLSPNMANNMLYHPPLLKEKGLKPNEYFLSKKELINFKTDTYRSKREYYI